MSFESAPRSDSGIDRRLDDNIEALMAAVRDLRTRLGPFLNPETEVEGPDALADKQPIRSALEERIHQVCASVVDARDVIEDIQARLYIPDTIIPTGPPSAPCQGHRQGTTASG